MARGATALEQSGFAGLLIHSGVAPYAFLDDQQYPYRVNPMFRLWAPFLAAEDCFVCVVPGARPQLVFHKSTDFWHLAGNLPDGKWTTGFDITTVATRDAARQALPRSLARFAYFGEPFRELLGWGIGAINPEHLARRLDFARARKTRFEADCLRRANRLGAHAHRAAKSAFLDGASEYGVHAAFLHACGQRESELPYNAIVALNDHGATLHYQKLDRTPPVPSRSLLLDAGVSCLGYGSDITRTWVRNDPDFSALVAALDRLQQSLCAAVKPGVDWREIHLLAVHRIAALLAECGVLRCSADEAAAPGGAARVFFPHGIGHLLGLQVHDVGGFLADPDGALLPPPSADPALRLTRRLASGFVVTMEPGIYFIDALLEAARQGPLAAAIDWTRVAALRPFGGIRIEDNLLVTENGCENLTRDAFAALAP